MNYLQYVPEISNLQSVKLEIGLYHLAGKWKCEYVELCGICIYC